MSALQSPTLALLVLSALVGLLVLLLVIAVLRMRSFAREARQEVAGARTDTAFMTSAMQDALSRLRDQERAMQQRAEASERFSDEIVNGITSGVLLVDAAGRLRLANPAARRMLGVTDANLDREIGDGLAVAPELVALVREAFRDRHSTARSLVPVSVAGQSRPLHLGLTVSPLVERDGTWQAVVCLFTDLTTVVALEEQVRMQDSLARLGELAAGIAHEFRNGLATIHGYARLLDPSRLEAPYADYVSGIRDETAALGRIVATFLDFARPVQLTLSAVDLPALIDRAVDDLRSDVTKQGGRIDVSGGWRATVGDDAWLRQVFMNVVRNAVEAVRGAGRAPLIDICGEVDADAGLQHIVIDDNGPGIADAVAGRIFQPFVTTRPDGTGLGLALVQKIVVLHGGRISATQNPAGGARFVVSLPLAA